MPGADKLSEFMTERSGFTFGHLKLTSEDLAQIERAVPADAVAGTRYPEEQMRWLDSEKLESHKPSESA